MATVSVVVQTLAGEEHHFVVPHEYSLAALKHEIHQATNIHPLCQNLVYDSAVLADDTQKLCDLSARASDSIFISCSVSDALIFETLSVRPSVDVPFSKEKKVNALEALGDLYEHSDNEEALSAAIENLRSYPDKVRIAATKTVAKLAAVGNVTAINALVKHADQANFFDDRDGVGTYSVLASLLHLADFTLVCELAVRLRFNLDDSEKRLAAKSFFEQNRSVGGVHELIVDQLKPLMASPNRVIREVAPKAFVDISEFGCKDAIRSMLPYILDEAATVRANVAQALASIAGRGDEDVVTAAHRAIEESISTIPAHPRLSPGRCHELIKIIPSIFKRDDQRSIRLLALCVDHSDFMVQTSARLALRKLGEFSTSLFKEAVHRIAFKRICDFCQRAIRAIPVRKDLEALLSTSGIGDLKAA